MMNRLLLVSLPLIALPLALGFDGPPCDLPEFDAPDLILSPQPHELFGASELPKEFDWRSINGHNSLVTISRNQHIPQYCGSCWAFATTSALSDRIKIARRGVWPEVNLAPQELLNCGTAGSCHGGSSTGAYSYMASNGIVDETCAPYQAKDFDCTDFNICRNCNHTACWAVESPKKYYVKEYGRVSGVDKMKAEIYHRGPISCSIAATAQVHAYTGGIFEDTTSPAPTHTTHVISVVGWGEEDGTPYWIMRNSWGTYWGEDGWMRIIQGKNNVLIESRCSWGVPDLDNVF